MKIRDRLFFTLATFALLVLATCLIRTDAHAIGTGSTVAVPSFTAGNRILTNPGAGTGATPIVLRGVVSASGTSKYTTLRKLGTSAGYQVTAGKTLTIWACLVQIQVASASSGVIIGYGDNDVGVSGSAPTNPLDDIGSTAGGASGTAWLAALTPVAAAPVTSSKVWTTPAAKYPFISVGNVTATLEAQCFGTEQ